MDMGMQMPAMPQVPGMAPQMGMPPAMPGMQPQQTPPLPPIAPGGLMASNLGILGGQMPQVAAPPPGSQV